MWLTAIGVIVAGAAAAFAWVQAHSAVESLRDAREARDEAQASAVESARLAAEANDAFKRQAEAQEEANRIKREEMEPDDWSVAQTGKSSWRVSNTSKRTMHVEALIVHPEAMKGFAHIETSHDNGVYEYGDSFTLTPIRYAGGGPEKLTIKYRREDDEPDTYRSVHISM